MTAVDATATWYEVHDAYLETHLDRIRLLAGRRVSWLKTAPRLEQATNGSGHARDAAPAMTGNAPSWGGDEAILAVDERLHGLESELVELGGAPSLVALAGTVGLSDVECDAVLAALAPELDQTFRGVYAYLNDDPSLRVATPGIVADLTGRSLRQVWTLFDPEVPSQRFGLFTRADGGSGAMPALQLDARVVTYLRGRNQPDDRLREVVDVLPDLALSPAQQRLVDELFRWLSDPHRRARQRVLNLLGPRGQGREAVAAALARKLGLVPLRLQPERLARWNDPVLKGLVDRETVLLPAALYSDAPAEAVQDAALVPAATRMLEDLGGLLMVGGRFRTPGREPAIAVDVPVLTSTDRVRLWQEALADVRVAPEDLDRLVEQFTFGSEEISRAVDEARALSEVHAPGTAPGPSTLWAACRTTAGADLGELATRLNPSYCWDDLVLPPAQQQVLRAITAQVAGRSRVYGAWGFGRRLPRGRGVTALFTGPSGTGKSMAAEVIAGHLALDLQRIDLSSVVSKYIGETEKNLRRVFDAAEAGGAVLFFDEADALFGKRTEVSDSHDRYANIEINYLLQRMEDYAGLAILATNRKVDLDPAFLRRLRFVVSFPFPDTALRRRLWQAIWPQETPLGTLDLDALSRLEIAGGNIRTIAVNAAFLAADTGGRVEMAHVFGAARHEYEKLDRRPTRAEFGDHYEEVRA